MFKKRGFSLVEVIVSVVIFSLVMVGLMSVFIAGNKHIIHTRERMTSAELEKFYLDPLQMYVRQDTWDQAGNQLATAGSPYAGASQTINNRPFTETHTVADFNSDTALVGTDLRRVTSTIFWTEPSS
jgi:prepilin-type N-terminal cleavage/methylation domain-containing protein